VIVCSKVAGSAAIYAGGPDIPRDPSLDVQTLAVETRSNAISMWPNPAATELHIAWRGDLKRTPRGYRILRSCLGIFGDAFVSTNQMRLSSPRRREPLACEAQP
jgi:hypothetical protein